ncbi:Conserved_hypothetical protein [Hexamita inflata]|uniref:Uncharacterized protein n=1 Tax=Hexamita inflata TaxID=28002 RepID=A0ABP1H824_9EUKA
MRQNEKVALEYQLRILAERIHIVVVQYYGTYSIPTQTQFQSLLTPQLNLLENFYYEKYLLVEPYLFYLSYVQQQISVTAFMPYRVHFLNLYYLMKQQVIQITINMNVIQQVVLSKIIKFIQETKYILFLQINNKLVELQDYKFCQNQCEQNDINQQELSQQLNYNILKNEPHQTQQYFDQCKHIKLNQKRTKSDQVINQQTHLVSENSLKNKQNLGLLKEYKKQKNFETQQNDFREAKEAERKGLKECREAKLENQKECRLAELENQKEFRLAELKNQKEFRLAELKNWKEQKEAELKNQKEFRLAELKNWKEQKEAELKNQKEFRLAELKNQKEFREAEQKNWKEQKEAERKDLKECREAQLQLRSKFYETIIDQALTKNKNCALIGNDIYIGENVCAGISYNNNVNTTININISITKVSLVKSNQNKQTEVQQQNLSFNDICENIFKLDNDQLNRHIKNTKLKMLK